MASGSNNANQMSYPAQTPSGQKDMQSKTLEQSSINSKEDSLDDGFGANENYVIVDIGANLTNKKFTRDLDSVVSRAQNAGVTKIMVPGTTVHNSKEALRLTRLFPGVLYSTAGVHPHEAKTWDDDTLEELHSLLKQHEVVAVGECGLDYNRNFSPPEVQLEVFIKQVELACSLKKPLIIHERDAHSEVVAVLRRYASRLPPTVIHCFTGDSTSAKAYLELGCYIGITDHRPLEKMSNSATLDTGRKPHLNHAHRHAPMTLHFELQRRGRGSRLKHHYHHYS
ncbi:TatD family [Trinorchestia longiramus]|nr:TatD family [Trinorchestia longiramus]